MDIQKNNKNIIQENNNRTVLSSFRNTLGETEGSCICKRFSIFPLGCCQCPGGVKRFSQRVHGVCAVPEDTETLICGKGSPASSVAEVWGVAAGRGSWRVC